MAGEAEDLETRRRLLAAVLRHAPFDGWSLKALEAGARDLGLGMGEALLHFPGGLAELAAFHHAEADRLMLKGLGAQDLSGLRIRERVALAVRVRLEPHAKDREAIRRELAYLAEPQHAALGLRCLYRTVDAVWHAIGDRSTDFNFYTKRALLAAVYGSTVLYWLEDKSERQAESWKFLDRRIADVMKVPQGLARIGKLAERLPDPLRLLRMLRRGRDATN
jgi:ubiquinone biosynthesis protein COQ9